MKLNQNTDYTKTKIAYARNYRDWSGHIDQDVMDADRRSQLHRRGDQLIAEARRNNTNREPSENGKRKGRSIAMDSAEFTIPYTIKWPDGRIESTLLRPVPKLRRANV